MRTAVSLFAVAGMTLAANQPQSTHKTLLNKAMLALGENGSYAGLKDILGKKTRTMRAKLHRAGEVAYKKGRGMARKGLKKLHHLAGEHSTHKILIDRPLFSFGEDGKVHKMAMKKFNQLRKKVHHAGEVAFKKGRGMARRGLNKLHHLAGEHSTHKILINRPLFSFGEDGKVHKMAMKKFNQLKKKVHHAGETARKHGMRFGKKVRAGMRKIHNHGEQSHVAKTAKLALLKKAVTGEHTVRRNRSARRTMKNGEHAVRRNNRRNRSARRNSRVARGGEHAVKRRASKATMALLKKTTGEHAVRRNRSARRTMKNGEHAVRRNNRRNRSARRHARGGENAVKRRATKATMALLKKRTVNGEHATRKNRRHQRNGESSQKKNRMNRRNRRQNKRHNGENAVKKTKTNKRAAMGLYELSSLLNLNDA